MPDAPKTFVVVGSFAPQRLAVYIVKGQQDEVVKAAQSLHQWFTITTLEAASSQTPNPWSGTLLKEVAFTHPTDAFDQAIRYASHHLRDLPEHQRNDAIERSVAILDAAARQEVKAEQLTDFPPVENLALGGEEKNET